MQHPASLASNARRWHVAKLASWSPIDVIWATATLAREAGLDSEDAIAAKTQSLYRLTGPLVFQGDQNGPLAHALGYPNGVTSVRLSKLLEHVELPRYIFPALQALQAVLSIRKSDMKQEQHHGMTNTA